MTNPQIDIDEIQLEELILLGEDKKIPITIEFPQGDKKVIAKALIKQLTLKETSEINIKKTNDIETSIEVLEQCLFKHNGENFTKQEILSLPMGVVNSISMKIMEVSGIDTNTLKDF